MSLGSPRSSSRDGDGRPPLSGYKCPRFRCGNAGGTAEGEPFVPISGEERLLSCREVIKIRMNIHTPLVPLFLLLLTLSSCYHPAFAPPERPTDIPLPSPVETAAIETSPSPVPTPAPAPTPTWIPSDNTQLYVLMYHSFAEDGTECNDWTTTASCFREDIQWLVEQGYDFILPHDLVSGCLLPEKAVMLTFDDGYIDNYTLAYPILQEFGARAVISLITRLPDSNDSGFLSWEMCREMAGSGLVEFGSHTASFHEYDSEHGTYGIQRYPEETREAYEDRILPDLQESIDAIEENLGQPVHLFAYPHGKKDDWAASFIQEHFSITLVTRTGPSDISKGLYSLRRYNINTTQRPNMYLK